MEPGGRVRARGRRHGSRARHRASVRTRAAARDRLHLGTGPDSATRVDVRFEAVEHGTRVTVNHDAGSATAEAFSRNASTYGRSWDAVLAAVVSMPEALAFGNTHVTIAPMATKTADQGTPEAPWQLKTPPGTSEYLAWRDPSLDPPALVVQVGKTQLRYHLRCIDDLYAMLGRSTRTGCRSAAPTNKSRLRQRRPAWGRRRDPRNPVKGWYGIQERLCAAASGFMYASGARMRRGLAEVEHNAKKQPDAREVVFRSFPAHRSTSKSTMSVRSVASFRTRARSHSLRCNVAASFAAPATLSNT